MVEFRVTPEAKERQNLSLHQGRGLVELDSEARG